MGRVARVRISVAAALITACLGAGTVAWAEMSDRSSGSQQLATGTLEAPTLPATAAGVCLPAVSDQIVVSWTRTVSERADGYEVLRAVGTGPYSSHAVVSGRTTESFTDRGLAFSTEYHYVIKAKKENWRSAGSDLVWRKTRTSSCL